MLFLTPHTHSYYTDYNSTHGNSGWIRISTECRRTALYAPHCRWHCRRVVEYTDVRVPGVWCSTAFRSCPECFECIEQASIDQDGVDRSGCSTNHGGSWSLDCDLRQLCANRDNERFTQSTSSRATAVADVCGCCFLSYRIRAVVLLCQARATRNIWNERCCTAIGDHSGRTIVLWRCSAEYCQQAGACCRTARCLGLLDCQCKKLIPVKVCYKESLHIYCATNSSLTLRISPV